MTDTDYVVRCTGFRMRARGMPYTGPKVHFAPTHSPSLLKSLDFLHQLEKASRIDFIIPITY
jgi:hypothetical protein